MMHLPTLSAANHANLAFIIGRDRQQGCIEEA
jgi:hypothetical protein